MVCMVTLMLFENVWAEGFEIVHDPLFSAQQDTNMGLEFGHMAEQLQELQTQTDRLNKEIAALENIENTTNVDGLLKDANKLIAQSRDLEYEINSSGTAFAKSYQGYKSPDEITDGTGSDYQSFYKDNVNMTLSTINNANKAIDDSKQNTDDTVNQAIIQAKGDIQGASGTNQAVGGLAEINVQILKQLQSMHTQLAAIAEAQNAADAKKIQEEATEEAEFKKVVESSSDSAKADLESIKSHPNNLGHISFPGN